MAGRARALSVETEHLLARETLPDLIATMPTDYGDAGAQGLFSGDATRMTFQSYDPETGERRTYTLALNDGVLAVDGMILGTEVDDLRISYFGQVEGADNRSWLSAWSDPIRVPELVTVEWLRKEIPTNPLAVYPPRTATVSPIVPR